MKFSTLIECNSTVIEFSIFISSFLYVDGSFYLNRALMKFSTLIERLIVCRDEKSGETVACGIFCLRARSFFFT